MEVIQRELYKFWYSIPFFNRRFHSRYKEKEKSLRWASNYSCLWSIRAAVFLEDRSHIPSDRTLRWNENGGEYRFDVHWFVEHDFLVLLQSLDTRCVTLLFAALSHSTCNILGAYDERYWIEFVINNNNFVYAIITVHFLIQLQLLATDYFFFFR